MIQTHLITFSDSIQPRLLKNPRKRCIFILPLLLLNVSCYFIGTAFVGMTDEFNSWIPNTDDRPALIITAQEGNLEAVNKLIQAGADVNLPDNDSYTALMMAIFGLAYSDDPEIYQYEEVVELLIKSGAKVNTTDNWGRSALYRVPMNGFGKSCTDNPQGINILKFLLENGADVNLTTEEGGTVLKSARLNRCTRMIQLLKDAGAHE